MLQDFVLLPARCAFSASSKNTSSFPAAESAFDLLVPLFPILFEKPIVKLAEFRRTQLLDLFFERFESRHDRSKYILRHFEPRQ